MVNLHHTQLCFIFLYKNCKIDQMLIKSTGKFHKLNGTLHLSSSPKKDLAVYLFKLASFSQNTTFLLIKHLWPFQKLSQCWPDCNSRDKLSLRIMSSFEMPEFQLWMLVPHQKGDLQQHKANNSCFHLLKFLLPFPTPKTDWPSLLNA